MIVLCSVAQKVEEIHKVKRGETLYSISKQYGLTPEELVKANPSIEKKMRVRLGQKLKIPKPAPKAVVPAPKVNTTAKETKEVKTEANSAGDKLFPKAEPVAIKLKTSSGNAAEYPGIFGKYASGGFKMKKNRGAANFINDNTSGNPYLAFYNDAETGSIVKVVNMMNKRTVYVKVVGRLPVADASREIIIKLSYKAARDLGAVDDKFLVEVAGYMQP